jgi:hypothetical protein
MNGARKALIVASDTYADPGLRQLHAPSSDAEALAAVLRDPDIGNFEVTTLLNEPAYEVNLAVEDFFSDRRPDDLLLVHFSCHGVKDESGELYFAMANTRLRRLAATGVAAEFVNRQMTRSRSRRVVLLLDCCYAGAFERGMTARAGAGVEIESQFGGRGRAVITASSAMEYAFEGDQLADTYDATPSVFTSALVEGLSTGDADRDQDGVVALDELYDYVFDRVRTTTPHQTPGKWTFGVEGDLFIARRSRPVTTPSPLPEQLQEAIDSPFAAVRAAAVQELDRLRRGRHAGLALGARLALEGLTEDDSRTVAAAASAALDGGQDVSVDEDAVVTPPSHDVSEPRLSREAVSLPESTRAPLATPPARSVQRAAPAHDRNGLLRPAAGLLSIAAAVAVFGSLFTDYVPGFRLADNSADANTVIIAGALALAGGVCTLIRRLTILVGAGLVFAAEASALAAIVDIARTAQESSLATGIWLHIIANLMVILAGSLVWLILSRSNTVRIPPAPPAGVTPWLVAVLGVANAAAFVFEILRANPIAGLDRQFDAGQDLVGLVLTVAAAVVVPGIAALAVPRTFGVALFGGAIANAVANAAYTGFESGLLGLTLVAMLVVIFPFAREAPATSGP